MDAAPVTPPAANPNDETSPAQPHGLAGKTVVVTGGTSGIGRATCLAFARRGARLAIAGRDEERGREVVEACRSLGAEALFVCTDVTRRDDVSRLTAAVTAHFGRLDVAFNNAGYQEPRATLVQQEDEIYERVFDTNVRALVYLMRAEIAVMLAQGSGGVIVNNASVSGVRNPYPGLSLYAASKAAAVALTRSAAMEYAPHGIRINTVSPGRILTPMMLGSGVADMSIVAAGLPLRRMGQPEEVGEAVVWLASPAASFVVGHNLCVDGGFLAG